jgi:hypothetical protein
MADGYRAVAGNSVVALKLHNQVVRGVLVILGAAAFGGLMSFVPIDGLIPMTVGLFVMAIAAGVAEAIAPKVAWARNVTVVAGLGLAIFVNFAAQATVLAAHGQRVGATVVGVVWMPGGRTPDYLYTLARDDRQPPNRPLDEVSEYAVGERVTVVVDPTGLVAPETAGEVAAGWIWWVAAGVAFVPVIGAAYFGRDKLYL